MRPACATVQAGISANSAIVFANLPGHRANADVVAVRIHMSPANGSQLLLPCGHGAGHGQAVATISADTHRRRRAHRHQFMSPRRPAASRGNARAPCWWPPAGGSAQPGVAHDLRIGGFLQFPADVTVVEPVTAACSWWQTRPISWLQRSS